MALFYYKEKKNKGIRAAAYLRLSIEDGDKVESKKPVERQAVEKHRWSRN